MYFGYFKKQLVCASRSHSVFFFFNDTAPTEIYTLSLHDALPISPCLRCSCTAPAARCPSRLRPRRASGDRKSTRLNSRHDQISYVVVCLKKKKFNKSVTITYRGLLPDLFREGHCILSLFFFFLMIRRPPRSTLFPTRRSSDLQERLLTGIDLVAHLPLGVVHLDLAQRDRKSTRLNSSHDQTSYAVFCLKKKTFISPSFIRLKSESSDMREDFVSDSSRSLSERNCETWSALPSSSTTWSVFFFLRIPRPPRSTLFPYTALFRSLDAPRSSQNRRGLGDMSSIGTAPETLRSEEHTSELQSRSDLVCRLLLEKK